MLHLESIGSESCNKGTILQRNYKIHLLNSMVKKLGGSDVIAFLGIQPVPLDFGKNPNKILMLGKKIAKIGKIQAFF